jgi:dTDP-4-amino-4,6-dideoxygalactose transaminase/nucleoside-diphosphate-sugar epimerase
MLCWPRGREFPRIMRGGSVHFMRILVTGGAGYVGCHLVPLLLDEGHAVRLFDRFSFGEEPLAAFANRPCLEIIRGDIRRFQEAPELLEGVDAVIHLAALANDPSCALDEDLAEDINVESMRELANLALQHGARRFVLASSCAVYGHGVVGPLDELTPPAPVSPLGHTKLRAEQALLPLRNDRFEPVVARLATLYGVSPRMRFDNAVNQMTATALRDRVITVHGGGDQMRPFLHVRDAARAFALLVAAPADAVAGEVFNAADPAGNYRIADLAGHVAAAFPGTEVAFARDDADLRSFETSCDKLRDRIGFAPEHTVDEGIAEAAAFLRDTGADYTEARFFNVKTLGQLIATPVSGGGEPMAPRFVPLYRPTLGPEEEQAVVQTLRSGWLTSAARVPAFEKLLAEAVGAPHAVAVTSCTAAFHLALARAGVGPGDEVVMTPLTWASMANTVVHLGARPVFADVLPDTLNMDPAAAAAAVTERTKAIVPVHLGGQPCDLDPLVDLAREKGLLLVEDAAHAFGASYKGRTIGSITPFTCFSFYAIKNITTIEGGAVTAWTPEDAAALQTLAHHGLGRTAWDRYGRSSAARADEVVAPGYKYKLPDVNAAIGIEQLRKSPRLQATRARIARLYEAALAGIDEITLPRVRDDVVHAWHLFIIRLRLDRLRLTRDELREELRRENIGTGLHFYGLHLHQYYREAQGWTPESCPNATAASLDMISLPLFPLMEDKHVRQVADALKKVLAHARR